MKAAPATTTTLPTKTSVLCSLSQSNAAFMSGNARGRSSYCLQHSMYFLRHIVVQYL